MTFDEASKKDQEEVPTLEKLLLAEVRDAEEEIFSGVKGDKNKENLSKNEELDCEPEKNWYKELRRCSFNLRQKEKQKVAIVKDQPKESIQPALQIQNKQANLPLQINPKVMSAMIKIATNSCKAMSYGHKQYTGVQNFFNPQEIVDLYFRNDPESIVRNLKLEENFRKSRCFFNITELVVEENRLGFRKKRKDGAEISMFWGPENSWIYDDDKESFPVGFTYNKEFYKMKSYDISIRAESCPRGQTPDHDNVFLSISYKIDYTFVEELYLGDRYITLNMVQKQPRTKIQPGTSKVLFNNCNVKTEKEKTQEISLVSILKNGQKIDNNEFRNLLDNSTKIKFQEIKKIWEDSNTQNLEIVVAKKAQQKKCFAVGLIPAAAIPLWLLGNPVVTIIGAEFYIIFILAVMTRKTFFKN